MLAEAMSGRHPRVLVVGLNPEALARLDPAPAAVLGLQVDMAYPAGSDAVELAFPTHPVDTPGGLGALRPHRVRSVMRATRGARRAGAPVRWVRAIVTDPALRARVATSDVVVSADPETDRAIEQVGELFDGRPVVLSADLLQVWGALGGLADAVTLLDEQCRARITGGRVDRQPLAPEVLAALRGLVDPASARVVPPELLPVDLLADTARWVGAALGPEGGADVLVQVFGDFAWGSAPQAGASGALAQLAAARIWLAPDETDFPSAEELARYTRDALEGADAALEDGEWDLARNRLVDALTLLFHRERHADTLSSPLVSDPVRFLADLYSNRTFARVVGGGHRPRLRRLAPDSEGEPPRVLVLSGAYGNFHGPVVEALSEEATVVLRRPRRIHRFFSRKGMDPQVLDALASLRGIGPAPGVDRWGVDHVTDEVRRTLLPRLRRADVVFTDWADRLTVWASHLAPADCRLVVRIHSLDALHPWFHLVDWTAVDEVIVVSEPLRRLVTSLLEVAGADVPVTVVPNIAALREADQPKHAEARTTLGMVGWGRRVKDPLWALELLEREPAWRLVLIGPDLPGRSASAKEYRERVARKLAEPSIRDRVDIVGWTDDVATHLRKVGVILSTSRRESWHLGLVEGAASGAVPVVRNWPLFAPLGGARSLFPAEWVVETLDEAERRIRQVTDPAVWTDEGRRARETAMRLFDDELVRQEYRAVVLGPLVAR